MSILTPIQCCTEQEWSESILENGSVIFQKSLGAERPENLYIYIYIYIYIYTYFIYITFIFNKNMQKDKLVAKCMKTCIFVLVDEYYIIMKFEMPSIVY
jgi:hypothetical protein